MIDFWRRHFILIEGVLILAGGLLIVYCSYGTNALIIIRLENAGDNISILSGLSGFFGTMLGFVIAIVTFMFGTIDQSSFSILRASKSYGTHWGIFKGALYSCFVATFLCVAGLIAAWLSLLSKLHVLTIIIASLWVLVRLMRVVWVLKRLIDQEIVMGMQSRSTVERL